MRANPACGQFCKEEIEAVNPTTCQTLLLFPLSQVFGKPTVFLSGGGLRIKCENSSLALRFCVAKSNPCDNIYEEFQKIQAFFAKVHKNTLPAPTIYMRQKLGGTMLTEAELQKQWERLTFTDDFIFSRVMHSKNLTQNTTTRSARRAASQLP